MSDTAAKSTSLANVETPDNAIVTSLPPKEKAFITTHKTESEIMRRPFTSTLTKNYKNPQGLVKIPYVKPFESTYVANRPIEDNIERAVDQIRLDKKNMKSKYYKEGYLAAYDIVVVGGGVMGCSVAFWLMNRVYDHLKILVVERDPTVS